LWAAGTNDVPRYRSSRNGVSEEAEASCHEMFVVGVDMRIIRGSCPIVVTALSRHSKEFRLLLVISSPGSQDVAVDDTLESRNVN
jgi:hypothetical protein